MLIYLINNRHASEFGAVYAGSAQLFIQLEQFKTRFIPLISPALVDMDAIVAKELTEADDWEIAFQIAKNNKEGLKDLLR